MEQTMIVLCIIVILMTAGTVNSFYQRLYSISSHPVFILNLSKKGFMKELKKGAYEKVFDNTVIEYAASLLENNHMKDNIITEKDNIITEKDNIITEKDKIFQLQEKRVNDIITEKDKIFQLQEKRVNDIITEKDKIFQLQEKMINKLEGELLQARSCLTGRWIFELRLKRIHDELTSAKMIKGKFNASETCRKVTEIYHERYNGNGKFAENCPYLTTMLSGMYECAEKNNGTIPNLVKIFGTLSEPIHNYGNSGPDVKILTANLRPEEVCLLESLATSMGLNFFTIDHI
jgi:hypothetical protein